MDTTEVAARQLRDMVQTQGWKHVMSIILSQVRMLDDYSGNENLTDSQRMGATSRRTALLWLARKVYHVVGESSPFDESYEALLGMLAPKPKPETDDPAPAWNLSDLRNSSRTAATRAKKSTGEIA